MGQGGVLASRWLCCSPPAVAVPDRCFVPADTACTAVHSVAAPRGCAAPSAHLQLSMGFGRWKDAMRTPSTSLRSAELHGEKPEFFLLGDLQKPPAVGQQRDSCALGTEDGGSTQRSGKQGLDPAVPRALPERLPPPHGSVPRAPSLGD